MSRRRQGWIVTAVGVVLIVLSPVIDRSWERFTVAVFGAAVGVVGLALVVFGGSSKPVDE